MGRRAKERNKKNQTSETHLTVYQQYTRSIVIKALTFLEDSFRETKNVTVVILESFKKE